MTNLAYICAIIGDLAGMPIRIYENKTLTFYHSVIHLPKDPICLWLEDIFSSDDHVRYFITPIFYYYGIVRSGGTTVVIGPTRQTPANEQDLKALAFQLDVPVSDADDFVLAMKNIAQMPLGSVLRILFGINSILNGEQLTQKDITVIDTEQENIKSLLENQADTQEEPVAGDRSANSYALEQTLMNMVRHGDTTSLKQWISNAPAASSGVIADDDLRQAKNTMIVATTLVCRNAIRGGMDVRAAFSLSDSYIKKCEILNSVDAITNLQYYMVLDYTERVERIREGKQPTKLALDVTNYVLHHISEPIKTEDIANALFFSRSRLSTRFREETGKTLTDFILKEKTIEAKRLLRYTNKTIISISEYLGFSSPAHFSRVFKKYAGVKPNEYRERKQ